MGENSSRYVPALRFRWLTPAYDVIVRATTRERTVKWALIAQANLAADQRVLDLACGTGTLAIWIKQHCPEASVTGRLVEVFSRAQFAQSSQTRTFSTVFGTLALYRAVKP